MFIESVTLRDFKSYAYQTFQFPQPTSRKNVCLVGAENGFGKTSLLEALMLCLYGKDGLTYLPRATVIEGDESKLALSYNDFLERALHGLALESGRDSMSVKVCLKQEATCYEITRIWHFWGNGKHRTADEELTVFENGVPFRMSRFEEKDEVFRHLIAKTFVPVYLAPFFLFDGEQVQRLAQRNMAAQVKVGVEGLLGVATLRELQADLRAYALNRRNQLSGSGSGSGSSSAEAELLQMQAELSQLQSDSAEIQTKLQSLRSTTEAKTRLVSAIASGNSATVSELTTAQARAEAHKSRLRDRLGELLRGDLAVSTAGNLLLSKLRKQLEREDEVEKWNSSREQGRSQFERLQAEFGNGDPPDPFTTLQKQWLGQQLERAWQSIWFPPPAGALEGLRHATLSTKERSSVLARLSTLGSLGLADLEHLLQDFAASEQAMVKAEARLRELLPMQEQAEKALNDLKAAQHAESTAKNQVLDIERRREALTAQTSQKKAEVERARVTLRESEPLRKKLEKASALADGIDMMIADMYPAKIEDVAESMTRVYKALAHKNLVHRVRITPDCEVELLDRKQNDLQRYDASAGESQIFAIALISAIAEVAKRMCLSSLTHRSEGWTKSIA